MFTIKRVLSAEFLKDLVKSTAKGIESRDCFFDQLHYVNRHFIERHKPFLAGIVAKAISPLHPGITGDDLVVVNDFVAPVNLENAQIHARNKGNKYDWHVDGIDRSVGPCYNLWIPVYPPSTLKKLDSQSLFDVIERRTMPELYLENGDPRANELSDPMKLPVDGNLLCRYLGVSSQYTVRESVLLQCVTGKLELFPRAQLRPTCVVEPQLGDVFLFNSNQYHASGPSSFARIAISIKFLVKEPAHGFRLVSTLPYPHLTGWLGVFLGCYYQFGDFTSYREYLEPVIALQQASLRMNQDKLHSIHALLNAIHQEL